MILSGRWAVTCVKSPAHRENKHYRWFTPHQVHNILQFKTSFILCQSSQSTSFISEICSFVQSHQFQSPQFPVLVEAFSSALCWMEWLRHCHGLRGLSGRGCGDDVAPGPPSRGGGRHQLSPVVLRNLWAWDRPKCVSTWPVYIYLSWFAREVCVSAPLLRHCTLHSQLFTLCSPLSSPLPTLRPPPFTLPNYGAIWRNPHLYAVLPAPLFVLWSRCVRACGFVGFILFTYLLWIFVKLIWSVC